MEASSPPWRRVEATPSSPPNSVSLFNFPSSTPSKADTVVKVFKIQRFPTIPNPNKYMEPSRKSVVRFEPSLDRHSEASIALQVEIPPSASPLRRRARSTGSLLEPGESERHRYRLCYQDDAYRLRSEARARSLMAAAASPPSSTSALLARKALKYRKVLDRLNGVDVTDPEFDVSKFLGVDWCKTEAPKELA